MPLFLLCDASRLEVQYSVVVKEYNTNMNRVDHTDQLRTPYITYRTSKKWWLYLLWYLFDIAVTNAFIQMKQSSNHQRKTRTGRIVERRQLHFCQNLSKLLMGNHCVAPKQKLTPSGDPSLSAGHYIKEGKRGR